jgi:hypothetical protein
MKMLLLALSLVTTSVVAQEITTNGGMPLDDPQVLLVARIPLGSGAPSPGETTGYSEALPVSDGLYHVPGYLPYESTAASLWPRVVDVNCRDTSGTWYCSGYRVDGILGRGEDIYVRPHFIKAVFQAPIPKEPVVIPVLPVVPPAEHKLIRHLVRHKRICD